MASVESVSGAKRVLTAHMDGVSKMTFVKNSLKKRALNGICGNCLNLRAKVGKSTVALDCKAGFDPETIYENLPFGKNPECDGHVS